MNEENKPPTTSDAVTEQDKGRCAPAPGSATAIFREWQGTLQEADKAVEELQRERANLRPWVWNSNDLILVTAKDVQILRHFMGKVIEHLKSMEVPPPNDRTQRCGRPKALELHCDVARPHSLQCSCSALSCLSCSHNVHALDLRAAHGTQNSGCGW